MKYADWKINRIRAALRSYRKFGHAQDQRSYTWKDVTEAICECCDLNFTAEKSRHFTERVRQFVEGVNDKSGTRKFPVPQEDSLEFIVRFVTDPDSGLLSPDDLRRFAPDVQAAMRLVEYLRQKVDSGPNVPSPTLLGTYKAERSIEDEHSVRQITLQAVTEDGLIQVIETEVFFEPDTVKDKQSKHKLKQASEGRHAGWAILTPEDNLLMFLKNERNGRNRYYFTLGSEFKGWRSDPVRTLALLNHDFPLELEDADVVAGTIADQIAVETARQILIFTRSSMVATSIELRSFEQH